MCSTSSRTTRSSRRSIRANGASPCTACWRSCTVRRKAADRWHRTTPRHSPKLSASSSRENSRSVRKSRRTNGPCRRPNCSSPNDSPSSIRDSAKTIKPRSATAGTSRPRPVISNWPSATYPMLRSNPTRPSRCRASRLVPGRLPSVFAAASIGSMLAVVAVERPSQSLITRPAGRRGFSSPISASVGLCSWRSMRRPLVGAGCSIRTRLCSRWPTGPSR